MSETSERLHQLFMATWNREMSADEAFEAAPDVDQLERELTKASAENERMREALAGLLGQVETFCEVNGEADFYTGAAKKALSPAPADSAPPVPDGYAMVPRDKLLSLIESVTGLYYLGKSDEEELAFELRAMIEAGKV